MALWGKKMSKPKEEPKVVAVPTPVMAVEYDGKLYKSLQSAEGARAKADLMGTLRQDDSHGVYDCAIRLGREQTIDDVVAKAEHVHGILSRYLAAKGV